MIIAQAVCSGNGQKSFVSHLMAPFLHGTAARSTTPDRCWEWLRCWSVGLDPRYPDTAPPWPGYHLRLRRWWMVLNSANCYYIKLSIATYSYSGHQCLATIMPSLYFQFCWSADHISDKRQSRTDQYLDSYQPWRHTTTTNCVEEWLGGDPHCHAAQPRVQGGVVSNLYLQISVRFS